MLPFNHASVSISIKIQQADKNMPYLAQVLSTTHKDMPITQFANNIAQLFEEYQLKSGIIVKDKDGLDDLLSKQLKNSAINPLVKNFIQFVIHDRKAAHEVGNFLLGDITQGHGTAVKSQAAGILITTAAKQNDNPDQANDCMRAGQGLLVGATASAEDKAALVTNTLVIESDNQEEGLNEALEYFQKAFELGNLDAAAEIAYTQGLISALPTAVIANVVTSSVEEISTGSSKSAKQTREQADRISRTGSEQMTEQTKKATIAATKADNKAIDARKDAAIDAAQVRWAHQNYSIQVN